MGENTMTTYVALFSLTDAGIKDAKDSQRRLLLSGRCVTDATQYPILEIRP